MTWKMTPQEAEATIKLLEKQKGATNGGVSALDDVSDYSTKRS